MRSNLLLISAVVVLFAAHSRSIEHATETIRKTTIKNRHIITVYYRGSDEIARQTYSKRWNGTRLKGSIPDGTVREYGENNRVITDASYLNNTLNGASRMYYDNGRLKSLTHYKDGIKDGPFTSYYRSGELWETRNYHEGKLIDSCTVVDKSGKILFESVYSTGVPANLSRGFQYYSSGMLKSDDSYQGYAAEGLSHDYYDNGVVKSQIQYHGAKRDGLAQYFYENGILKEESTYLLGTLNGTSRKYYDFGTLKETAAYTEGNLDGDNTLYSPQGNVLLITAYYKGRAITRTEFGPQNALQHSFQVSDSSVSPAAPR